MYRAHVLRVKSEGSACVTILNPSPTPLRILRVSDRPLSESAGKTGTHSCFTFLRDGKLKLETELLWTACAVVRN
jgi:hypothetical protein